MSAREKTTDCPPPLLQDARPIKTRATAEAWSKKGHSYKPLPTSFRRDGFGFRQIAREGDAFKLRFVAGKSPSFKTTVFPAAGASPGDLVRVRVQAATPHTLTGVRVTD